MKVIPPISITDTLLLSSTVSEPSASETVWNGATNYVVGNVVILVSTHRVYECLINNTGFSPDVNVSGVSPKWLDIGPTNKWAMFELLRNTATIDTSPIIIELAPGTRADSIAIINTISSTILVEVYSNSILEYTNSMIGAGTTSSNIILFDLPPFIDSTIKVTLSNTLGSVTCGAIVIGKYYDIGDVQNSVSSEALNFSTVERDTFGNVTLIPRRSVPKVSQTLFLLANKVNSVRRVREKLNALPAVWSGLDNANSSEFFNTLIILGYYRTFNIQLDTPISALVTIDLEEL